MDETEALTGEQTADFRRDGFVFAPGFYDRAEMDTISAWIEEVAAWPEAPGRHMVYHEDSLSTPGQRLVQRIEDVTPFHAGLKGLFTRGRMSQAVGQLLGEPAILFKDKINFKLPGGDGFKAHQDVQAGWSAYAGYHVSVLVSIDAATEANGCLEMAAGWHDRGLIGAEWEPLGEAKVAAMNFVPYPTEPGDAVFFDSFAPHRSAPNLSQDPRRALYVTYNRASEGDQRARYVADKRESFPPDIEREPGKTYVFRV